MIQDNWRERLYSYIGTIIKNRGAVPLAIGGTSDHIHLLFGSQPSVRIDYLVRDIKAESSRFVKSELGAKFGWQKGYGGFTVSPLAVESVKRYVDNQERHHAKQSFQDEYIELLEKSNTPYDDKYLW
jgi:putative transposase